MLQQNALDHLFNTARTHNDWQQKQVPEETLKKIFDLTKMAPTSVNCSPLRITFIISSDQKEKLRPCLMEANVEKTMTAPVTALLATDYEFYNHLPTLFPHTDARSWFVGNQEMIDTTAFRNATLQIGYFILAARACGVDCGPMSGFNQAQVDETFLKGTPFKSNILCNLGYGDLEKIYPRSPRFEFSQVCQII